VATGYADRHVVVTGGTGALGAAVVGALLEAGAVCHVPYRSEGQAVAFPHRNHDRVRLVPCGDLADETVVTRYYDALTPLWASIHLAGGFAFAPLAQSDQTLLLGQLQTNLVSTYLCCRAAVAAFRRTGAGGRLVNVASRQALEPRLGSNMTAYACAKAGVAALTVALGEELAKEDILVNAVAPSILDTPANRNAMSNAHFAAWPKVEDVAQMILFLASPENHATRGAVIPVYGKV
jgi:NAD(P)-dependent dehydrogenase (short-subunit alcohol dehydrogenase family)